MKSELASLLNDNLASTCHPRLDFRTEEARRYTARLRPFLEKNINKGQRVLDLGCGAGKHTFELEILGAIASGMDCSKGAILHARKIADEINSSAKFHIGSYENIPFPQDSFDAVLFPQNIIECSYEEMERIVFQLHSILSRGGKFFLEMQDGLDKARSSSIPKTEKITGIQETRISIPDKGSFKYHTTFWTIAFARFVVGKYLSFKSIEPIDHKSYMLVFENSLS